MSRNACVLAFVFLLLGPFAFAHDPPEEPPADQGSCVCQQAQNCGCPCQQPQNCGCPCQQPQRCGCPCPCQQAQGCGFQCPCECKKPKKRKSPTAIDGEEPRDPKSYREGAFRLGAFWVGRFDTSVVARADNFPLGLYLDLTRELGLSDSVTVPRAHFSYRFSRRNQLNLEFFRIRRTKTTEFGRVIGIGPIEFPIGVRINVESISSIYKASYTWIFYDRDKVWLGANFGLNVINFQLGLRVDEISLGEGVVSEREAKTAPLPLVGIRLHYRANTKLDLIIAADTLLVEIGPYAGDFLDTYALVEYRLSPRFSVGGGLNFLKLELDYDQDLIAEFRHSYRGVTAFFGVHF